MTYKKPHQTTIFISISQRKGLIDIIKLPLGLGAQIVKVGELDGVWVKTPGPEYPHKEENGVGKSDLPKKPTIKKLAS